MKLLFACAFALCLVFSFAQDENLFFRDQMKTYGTGVVLVPINRAALTITATGTGSAAADAVTAATNLQSMMNDTLSSSFTIFDVRSGGFFLMPVYDGSSLSFMARRSLSVVVPADELADVIDSMIGLGASNITFLFVPDFTAVEAAQAQALKLAVVDGLWKAQAVLDTIGHCARNITTIEIKNPALEIPTITFNLFANMGNTFNRQISNVNMPSTSDMSGNANANANLNMRADNNIVMLGAGSPLIEGDRQEIVAYVEMWLGHATCGSESNLIDDLRSGLDMSNLVGFSGGSFETTSASGSESGSESGSGSGINTRRRAW